MPSDLGDRVFRHAGRLRQAKVKSFLHRTHESGPDLQAAGALAPIPLAAAALLFIDVAGSGRRSIELLGGATDTNSSSEPRRGITGHGRFLVVGKSSAGPERFRPVPEFLQACKFFGR
jgi:hypothetical protein